MQSSLNKKDHPFTSIKKLIAEALSNMTLEKISDKQPNSVLGKISIYAGLLNIVLFLAGNLVSSYASRAAGGIFLLAFLFSLSIGITTGIAALVARRAWLGLLLNALMVLFLIFGFVVYYSFCCKPLPTQL